MASGAGADLLGEQRPLLDREAIDLAPVGMLGGRGILLGGRLLTRKPVKRRFLAGDSIPTAGLGGGEQGIVGVVDGLIGCLLLAFAAGLLALSASVSRVGGLTTRGLLPHSIGRALVTELRADPGADADRQSNHDHRDGDPLQPWGRARTHGRGG